MPSARQAGLGNAVTALADDEYLLFANPAGLGLQDKFLKDDADTIAYFNFVSGGISELSSQIDLVSKLQAGGLSGVNTAASKFDRLNHSTKASASGFSYLSDSWGITFLPLVNVRKIYYASNDPIALSINGLGTIQLSVGFKPIDIAFSESQSLAFGFAIRPFYYFELDLLFNKSQLVKSLTIEQLDEALTEGVGAALDLGLLYKISFEGGHRLNVGLVISEAPAFYYSILSDKIVDYIVELTGKKLTIVNGTSFLQPNPKLGVAYILPNYLESFFTKTSFSIDVHRWLDSKQSAGTKFHFG